MLSTFSPKTQPLMVVYSLLPLKAVERRIPLEDFLEKSIGFINPTNVVHLSSELGLDSAGASLMESLDGESFYFFFSRPASMQT
jgi:hypothetical protein